MQAAGHDRVPATDASGGTGPADAVLAFFAHPDDETLGAGGVIARLAAARPVHLVTATRGELGERMAPLGERSRTDPIALAGVRVGELAAAARALGVREHRFLDELDGADGRVYTDSGMSWADDLRRHALPAAEAAPTAFSVGDLETQAAILAGEIRRLRPVLVLTEEPGGGYGHPDHVRAHAVAVRAVELAGSTADPDATAGEGGDGPQPWRVPVVAAVVRERAALVRAQQWVAAHPELPAADSYGVPLRAPDPDADQASGAYDRVDLVLDTSVQIDQVISAMTAYHTQVHAVTRAVGGRDAAGWFALTNNDLQPILTHAALVLVPGHGRREDLVRIVAGPGLAGLAGLSGRRGDADPLETGPAVRWAFAGLGLLTGVLAGAVTTTMHRALPPWGLLAGILVLVAGMVLSRSLGERPAMHGFGAGTLGIVLAVTAWRPGDDIVIVQDALGLGWLGGVFVAVLAGLMAPRRWFDDRSESASSG